MKHTNVFGLILTLLIAHLMFGGCQAPERDQISAMTFNIRFDNPEDGMFGWDYRKDLVIWTIKTYKPDVLGVQEALAPQVYELDSALTDYNWTGLGRDDGNVRGEFVPIYYRKDRFAKLDEGHFWLSEQPHIPGSLGWDAACTRMVSWVKLKEVNSGYEYFFFNTHFDHVGEEARLKSAALLSDSIRAIAQLKPLVVMGDFNCEPGSGPYKRMLHLFGDAATLADKKTVALPTTFLGFPPNIQYQKIIDHIFVSPHFGVKEYEIAAENSGGYFPSDHLPVWVWLELRMP